MGVLNDIDWEKILSPEEYIFKEKSKKVKVERIKQAFKSLFNVRPNLEKNKIVNTDFLFVKSMKRHDYDWLFNEIITTCENCNKEILDIQYMNSNRKRIYPLIVFFKYLFLYRKAQRSSFLDTIYLTIKMINYLEIYDKTKYYNYENLIVFADMQPIDNMLVQIAKKKNIRTVTMQHGLYIDYKNYSTVNETNYTNAVADIFLAWGKDTAELINKYHPNITTEVMGKPFESKKIKKKENYFTVVFDSNYFIEHNIELLEIAYEICDTLNLKVNLGLHPNNRIEYFKIKEDMTFINKDIMSSRFILGHTTTMLYDCMMSNMPSFRYKTDKPSNKILKKLEFNSSEELISILNDSNIMNLDFNKISKDYFKYISVESKNKYIYFFKNINQVKL